MANMMAWLANHPRVLPERVIRGAFLAAADVAWLLRVGSVRQLERNLSHVLTWSCARPDAAVAQPTPVDAKALRRMSRRGMRSYFTYFSEALTVGARSERQLKARIRGTGSGLQSLFELTAPSQGNRSAPVAMGHQGNWDYDGFWARYALAPVTTVAERLADTRMLEVFVAIRERLGIRILLTGTPHLTERLEDELAKPHVIVPLLADRDLSRHGEFVEAFGSTIRVARGPATLAYDTGSPLYVANTYRERLTGARRKEAGTPMGMSARSAGRWTSTSTVPLSVRRRFTPSARRGSMCGRRALPRTPRIGICCSRSSLRTSICRGSRTCRNRSPHCARTPGDGCEVHSVGHNALYVFAGTITQPCTGRRASTARRHRLPLLVRDTWRRAEPYSGFFRGAHAPWAFRLGVRTRTAHEGHAAVGAHERLVIRHSLQRVMGASELFPRRRIADEALGAAGAVRHRAPARTGGAVSQP